MRTFIFFEELRFDNRKQKNYKLWNVIPILNRPIIFGQPCRKWELDKDCQTEDPRILKRKKEMLIQQLCNGKSVRLKFQTETQ